MSGKCWWIFHGRTARMPDIGMMDDVAVCLDCGKLLGYGKGEVPDSFDARQEAREARARRLDAEGDRAEAARLRETIRWHVEHRAEMAITRPEHLR